MSLKKKDDDPSDSVARKDYKKGIALYRERLSKQPKNSLMRLSLADTLLLDGQTAEAMKEYKELGKSYTEEGFLVKAIAMYKKILKHRPDDKEVERLLSHVSDKRAPTPAPPPSPQPAPAKETKPEPAAVTDFEYTIDPPPAPASLAPQLELETKLFKSLTTEEFSNIVAKLSLRHYEEDTIVVMEGDPGKSLFIVCSGQVRVVTKDAAGKEIVLANLGEGEFFGEVALLTGRPRTATIITNWDTELLELTHDDYESIIAKHPRVKIVMEEFHRQRAYKTIEAIKSKPR